MPAASSRTASSLKLGLLFAAAIAVEEAALMVLLNDGAGGDREIAALGDAAFLAALFAPAYYLIVRRYGPPERSRPHALCNTAIMAVVTFAAQSASHLFSEHLGRGLGETATVLADAATMAAAVPAFGVWLEFVDRRGGMSGGRPAPIPSAVGGAVFGGGVLVALIATVAPFVSLGARELSGPSEGQLVRLLDLAGRQRMWGEAIARNVAEKRPDDTLRGLLAAADADQRDLDSLMRTYVERAEPSGLERAALPGNPDLTAARSRYIAAAQGVLAAPPEAREGPRRDVRDAVDAFMPKVRASVTALSGLEAARGTAPAHVVYLSSLYALTGLLAFSVLWPMLRLMAAKQAELATSLEKARLALAEVDSYKRALDLHAIVGVADAKGRIIHANDRFCEISGYSREELVGQDHRILNSGLHGRAFFVDMWRTIGRGQPFRAEFRNRAKDGSHYWVDSMIVPVPGSDGRPERYVSIRFDVTGRKRAEAELRSANDFLEHRVAERTQELERAVAAADAANAAKSDFLATMSHELRTPLTSVVSYAEVIQESAVEDGRETDAADAEVIIDASRHLLALISEILDFAKIEAGRLTFELAAFPAAKLFADVETTVRPLVAKNRNTLELNVASDIGELTSDYLRLRQCILNLVSNAAKFTADGRIALSARTRAGGSGPLLEIAVSDTGVGMSAETLDRLFQPFTQADASISRRYGGTGLGLSITREICRALGGDIEASSVEGRGSTFVVTVPVDSAAASSAGEAAA